MTEAPASQPATTLPRTNTHVHVPPNFSAFKSVDEVVTTAQEEGMAAIGISNFYDQSVYSIFATRCLEVGVTPLFGLEFITLDQGLAQENQRINDPANPGRIYLCGKGADPFCEKTERAEQIATQIRRDNDQRAAKMIELVAEHFNKNQVPTQINSDAVAQQVAASAGVDSNWVSLQERHIAQAFYRVIAELPAAEQRSALARVYGTEPSADPADPTASQAEIRSRLLKVGTVGYVPEAPLSFEQAMTYVQDMGGIVCYPILADGAPELSSFEWPPENLVDHLLQRGIYAAELITNRNASEVVDRYVQTLTAAGIIVMAGTEHNTPERIPLTPTCADGPISPTSAAHFYQGTCVVAAHQYLRTQDRPGYVDSQGRPVDQPLLRAKELAELGDQILRGKIPFTPRLNKA